MQQNNQQLDFEKFFNNIIHKIKSFFQYAKTTKIDHQWGCLIIHKIKSFFQYDKTTKMNHQWGCLIILVIFFVLCIYTNKQSSLPKATGTPQPQEKPQEKKFSEAERLAQLEYEKELKYKKEIERVLQELKTLEPNTENIKSIQDCQNLLSHIHEQMSSISLKGCPHEFTNAYLDYTNAIYAYQLIWDELSLYKTKYDSFGSFINSFLRGLSGDTGMLKEADEKAFDLRAKYNEALINVKTCYMECLKIASKYEVEISYYKPLL